MGIGPADSPQKPTRSGDLLLLTAAGLAARVAFLLLEPATAPVADERTWIDWARNLASDKVGFSPFRTKLVFYPPLYHYFIAVVETAFGSLAAAKWAQVFIGSLLIPAVGRVAAQAFGPAAGLAAAAIAAFYPELIWFSVHFWSETLFLVLLWWAIERLLAADGAPSHDPSPTSFPNAGGFASAPRVSESRSRESVALRVAKATLRLRHPDAGERGFHPLRAALVAGLLWGLAILTRETILYFTPLAALWMAFRRKGSGRSRAAVFLLTALLVVAPWTCRNWIVYRGFIPVSTAGGLNLFQGNALLTRQQVYNRYQAVSGRLEQYQYARRMGIRAILERQPAWFLEKLRDEMPLFWEADSLALVHIKRGAYGSVSTVWAAAAALAVLLPYLSLLALFVAGLAAFPLLHPRLLLIGFLVYYTALHVATHGFARYRLPVMPVLFVVAGAAWTALRQRSYPPLRGGRARLAVALAIVFVLCLIPSFRRNFGHPAFGFADTGDHAAEEGPPP